MWSARVRLGQSNYRTTIMLVNRFSRTSLLLEGASQAHFLYAKITALFRDSRLESNGRRKGDGFPAPRPGAYDNSRNSSPRLGMFLR